MAVVLVIEDDVTQRQIARLALRKAGHEVLQAQDGSSGLQAARDRRPDVVVCDVMMPGMNGYAVVEALRADRSLALTPVILLTAMSDRGDVRRGMVAGADDYLTKPYRPDELCEAVAAALTRRRVQQESFASTIPGIVEEVLEGQKENLARQYEQRLVRELSGRWVDHADAVGDLHYPDCVVLLADLLGAQRAAPGDSPQAAARLKQAQQVARDTFYLFGAEHVLPHGNDYLALFAADEHQGTAPAELRAARAALALARSARSGDGLAIGLHAGPVRLIALNDALHGDQGHAVVPGETLDLGAAMRTQAARAGWRVAASPLLAERLGAAVQRGRSLAAGDSAPAAVELLAARAA